MPVHPDADVVGEAVLEEGAVEHFVVAVPGDELAFEMRGGVGGAFFEGGTELVRGEAGEPGRLVAGAFVE